MYRTQKKIEQQQRQISENEKYIERVNELAEEIEFLEKSISVSDSVGRGFDDVLTFLEQAHKSFKSVPNIWAETVIKGTSGYLLAGQTFHKIAVPKVSNLIGNSVINTIIRTEHENSRQLFAYELDVAWRSTSSVFDLLEYQQKDTVAIQKDEPKESIRLDKSNSVIAGVEQIKERVMKDVNKTTEKLSGKLSSRANTVLEEHAPEQMTRRDSIATIILYRYDEIQAARRDSLQMTESGYKVFIANALNDPKNKKYWLCMGSYPSRQEAERLLNENGEFALPKSDIVTIPWPFGRPVPQDSLFFGGASGRPMQSVQKMGTMLTENKIQSEQSNAVEKRIDSKRMTTPRQQKTHDKQNKLAQVIRVSAHAVKITADQEILYLRKNGIECYCLYEPHSSAPYWVCSGRFNTTAAAVEHIQTMRQRVQREYEIINIPKTKLEQN